MSAQEAERRRRQRAQSEANRDNDHRILSFREWCELNGFSPATGRRVISSADGPVVTQLSARRIGITIANNRAWQAAHARGVVVAALT
jgi:hypothetical protein